MNANVNIITLNNSKKQITGPQYCTDLTNCTWIDLMFDFNFNEINGTIYVINQTQLTLNYNCWIGHVG